MSTFTGSEPITRWSDNYSFLNNQINDSGVGFTSYAVDTGTANNLIVTLASAPVAYEAGMMVCTNPAFTNTGASVINVNALGNIPIVNPANIALNGGEISFGSLLALIYDGTSFRILGPCPLNRVLTGLTASTNVVCAGATAIYINAAWGSGSGLTLTMQQVSYGVPIIVSITNQTGSSTNFSFGMTDPAGTSFTTINVIQGGQSGGASYASILAGTGSFTLGNNTAMTFTGSSVSALRAFFIR